jgi:hypothetical protein
MLNSKLETLNSKQTQMPKAQNSKQYNFLSFSLNHFGFRLPAVGREFGDRDLSSEMNE